MLAAGFITFPSPNSAVSTWGLDSDDGAILSIGGPGTIFVNNSGAACSVPRPAVVLRSSTAPSSAAMQGLDMSITMCRCNAVHCISAHALMC